MPAHLGNRRPFAHDRCDCAGNLHVVSGEVHVERDQGPARSDDDTARTLVELRRTVVRAKLARVDAALELLRTAAPVERGASLRRRVAVEEHGQADLGADAIRESQRAIRAPVRDLSGSSATIGTTSAAPIRG